MGGRSKRHQSKPHQVSVIALQGASICCCLLICCLSLEGLASEQPYSSSSHQNQQETITNHQPNQVDGQPRSHLKQRARQNNAPSIYINPNPSTRSWTSTVHGNLEHRKRHSLPLIDNLAPVPSSVQTVAQPVPSSLSSSSIGRGEQSQVADWPFFKSLQNAKNNLASSPERQSPASSSRQQQLIVPNNQRPASMNQAPRMLSSRQATSSEVMPTIITNPTTTTTTIAPTPTPAPTSTTTSSIITDQNEVEMDSAGTTEGSISTTEATADSASGEMVESDRKAMNRGDSIETTTTSPRSQLYSPSLHQSIQMAVDRIVKMSAESQSSNSTTAERQHVVRSRIRPASSLSLNVLFKNFGVHNLTNLDQILLRSTLAPNQSEQASSQSQQPSSPEQRIAITGVSNHLVSGDIDTSGDEDDDEASGNRAAECKIEYKMRHVNVSLMNGARGDYTCDYIIDRSMATPGKINNGGSSSVGAIAAGRACRLRLKSSFFSDRPESQAATCTSGTHLVIGPLRFCYLKPSQRSHMATLNRTFDFPMEREAFDIKMVHRQHEFEPQEPEILLEIKPLVDADCFMMSTRKETESRLEYAEPEVRATTTTTTSTTTSTTTATTEAPSTTSSASGTTTTSITTMAPQVPASQPQVSRDIGYRAMNLIQSPAVAGARHRVAQNKPSTGQQQQQRQEIVANHDKDHLRHPVNRLAQQVSARGSPAVRPKSDRTVNTSSTTNKRTLCDGLVHRSVAGQLGSPDYPQPYEANMSCSFVIEQASAAHCHLSLHFRDFDLVTNSDGEAVTTETNNSNENHCPNDYLQIGTTRYCNKYAMIGHKMRLDFAPPFDAGDIGKRPAQMAQLELNFHSDHMRGGRGLLLKYHQIPCIAPTAAAGQAPAAPQRSNTLAPPVQQPDFGLALRTSATTQHPMTANSTLPTGVTMTPMASSVSTTLDFGAGQQEQASTMSDQFEFKRREQQEHLNSSRISSCNQLSSELTFSMLSPRFPEPYANNLECIYYVRRNSSQVCYLELTFVKFDLEPDADCRYDYMEINGVRLCGSIKDQGGQTSHKTTRIYLFNEPIKAIKFKSDDSGSQSGFYIKAEQLKCAASGSILREIRPAGYLEPTVDLPVNVGRRLTSVNEEQVTRLGGLHSGSRNNNSRTIEYDDQSSSSLTSSRTRQTTVSSSVDSSLRTRGGKSQLPSSADFKPFACDEFLFGKESTIKSPLWPASYGEEESISQCRYTIVRDSNARYKICQLELKFLNLRLGPSDCIDVDGYELLCGFNAPNMVKYYPFDKQTHLTVTFFTGSSLVTNLAARRSLSSSLSDQLPKRTPFRFMIKAKQHECIDDFLAPTTDDTTASGRTYNQTNLLYSLPPASSLPSQAGTSSSSSGLSNLPSFDFTTTTGRQDGPLPKVNRKPSRTEIMYSPPANQTTLPQSSGGVSAELQPTGSHRLNCLNLGLVVSAGEQLFSANYPLGRPERGYCELELPLAGSTSKCQLLELEILDLDLERGGSGCDSDYLQIRSPRSSLITLCSMEQAELRLGTRRQMLLPLVDGPVSIALKSTGGLRDRRGFRLRQRPIQCQPSGYLDTKLQPTPTYNLSPISSHTDLEPKLIDRMPLLQGKRHQQAIVSPHKEQATGGGGDTADMIGNEQAPGGCLAQFGQYNGILGSASVLAKLRANSMAWHECELRIKLLPGFCQVQLSFGEFELAPRLSGQCLFEYLELDHGVRYCASELLGLNQTLTPVSRLQRMVSIRYGASNASSPYAFRAVFKQIQCQPEPLRPLTGTLGLGDSIAPNNTSLPPLAANPADSQVMRSPTNGGADDQQTLQRVEFKEIALRGELMELSSAKVSKSSDHYDPNMFIIYRIKRYMPEVCKLRLMFYYFDLEPSTGCKRDFLDINNHDRLCGQLGKDEDTRRDYDWPSSQSDFLVSFVSDSSRQLGGFIIFGQQIHSNCSSSTPMASTSTSTTTTSTTTTTTTTSTTTPAPSATFDEEDPSGGGGKSAHRQNKLPQSSAGKQIPAVEQHPRQADCHQLHYEEKFEISSPNWPQRYPKSTTCHYLVHKASSSICSLSLNVVSMILGAEETTDCQAESDHLNLDGQVLCGLISRPRQVNIEFGQRQFVGLKFRSVMADGFGFLIEAKQNECSERSDQIGSSAQLAHSNSTITEKHHAGHGSSSGSYDDELEHPDKATSDERQSMTAAGGCNKLLVNEFSLLESDDFPHAHRHNQDCLYALRRRNQSICAIDLVMMHFDLEGPTNSSGTCDRDYLEIDYTRLCGSYPSKHRLRFNYFEDERDKVLRFHSDASLAKSGFSIQVRQVADCHGPTHVDQAPALATSGVSVGDHAHDELISYLPSLDAATVSSKHKQENPQRKSESQAVLAASGLANSSEDELSGTLCQFVYHSERQFILSPHYSETRRNYDANVDCQYKIVAPSYDICALRLQVLDLDLDKSNECQSDYLLIDNRRYCSQQQFNNKPLELKFADTLPREIHMIFHTDDHLNAGRGFKLLYEQVNCSANAEDYQTPTSSRHILGKSPRKLSQSIIDDPQQATERETRRSKFGQLSYPKNYITGGNQQTARHTRQPKGETGELVEQPVEPFIPQPTDETLASHRRVNFGGRGGVINNGSPIKLRGQRNMIHAKGSAQAVAGASTAAELDLAEQHPGVTLRKGIVVAPNPVPSAAAA